MTWFFTASAVAAGVAIGWPLAQLLVVAITPIKEFVGRKILGGRYGYF